MSTDSPALPLEIISIRIDLFFLPLETIFLPYSYLYCYSFIVVDVPTEMLNLYTLDRSSFLNRTRMSNCDVKVDLMDLTPIRSIQVAWFWGPAQTADRSWCDAFSHQSANGANRRTNIPNTDVMVR